MHLELRLSAELEARIQEAALAAGLTPNEYLTQLVRFQLAETRLRPLRARIAEKLRAAGIEKEEDFYTL